MGTPVRYTNVFEVGFDAFEVIITCAQRDPSGDEEAPHTKLVTSPGFAKQLARMLADAVADYEARFGPIPDPTDGSEETA